MKKQWYNVEYVEIRRQRRCGCVLAESLEEASLLAEEKYEMEYREDGIGGGFGQEVVGVEGMED